MAQRRAASPITQIMDLLPGAGYHEEILFLLTARSGPDIHRLPPKHSDFSAPDRLRYDPIAQRRRQIYDAPMTTEAGSPRNVAGPIVRGSDFWGRQAEVDSLWRLLKNGSVLLTAPRRHGKSSLMSALADSPRPDWTVCQIDVEYIEKPEEFLTELTAMLLLKEPFRRLLKRTAAMPAQLMGWVGKMLESVSVGLPGHGELKLGLRDALLKPQQWPELAEQLFSVMEAMDGDVLLIIDEFPMMIASFLDRNEEGAVAFLKWFRAQRQRTDRARVRLVLGGSVNIEPRLEAIGRQALLNDLQRFRLEQMARERSIAFVGAVLEGEQALFHAGVPDEIVRVADCGIHFFLQVLISECLLEARRRGTTLASSDVEPVYRDRVLGPSNRARFSHYLTRLKEHYGNLEHAARIVLGELARNGKRREDELLAALRAEGVEEVAVSRTLVLLESDYYVLRDAGGVWFTSGFLRDWWLRNVPVAPRLS